MAGAASGGRGGEGAAGVAGIGALAWPAGDKRCSVDGKLAGHVSERLEPNRFVVGGVQADYKDLLIYRSALNADEIAALESGRLLQASLEVYSPLVEPQFRSGGTVENLAQSLTAAAAVGAGSVQHVDR